MPQKSRQGKSKGNRTKKYTKKSDAPARDQPWATGSPAPADGEQEGGAAREEELQLQEDIAPCSNQFGSDAAFSMLAGLSCSSGSDSGSDDSHDDEPCSKQAAEPEAQEGDEEDDDDDERGRVAVADCTEKRFADGERGRHGDGDGLGRGRGGGVASRSVPSIREAQVQVLAAFYTEHDPAKDADACGTIIDKRRKKKSAMSTHAFAELCDKLASKYGEHPLGDDAVPVAAKAAAAEEVDKEVDEDWIAELRVVRGARVARCAEADEGQRSAGIPNKGKKDKKKQAKERRRAAERARQEAAAGRGGGGDGGHTDEDSVRTGGPGGADIAEEEDGGDDGEGGDCEETALSAAEFRAQNAITVRVLRPTSAGSEATPEPVRSFANVAACITRSGAAVGDALVEACVATIGGAAPKPSLIQAECWGALLGPPSAAEHELGETAACLAISSDLVASSFTGSGKTLAFLLPLFAELSHAVGKGARGVARPAALVLAPTRELCQQIGGVAKEIAAHPRMARGGPGGKPLRVELVVGGVDFAAQRTRVAASQPHLVTATPGRLLSLCGVVPASSRARARGGDGGGGPVGSGGAEAAAGCAAMSLERVRWFVLDEADRMLDSGFAEDLDAIVALLGPQAGGGPARSPDAGMHPRTWMFSATFPAAIELLAERLLAPGTLHISVGHARKEWEDEEAGQRLLTAASVRQCFEHMRGRGAPRARRLLEILRDAVPRDDGEGTSQGEGGGEVADSMAEGGQRLRRIRQRQQLDGLAAGDEDGVGPRGCEAVGRGRVLVFVMFKQEAVDVAKALVHKGLRARALQGDMSQRQRELAMQAFRSGEVMILVATDVAARGLDVEGVTTVVNYSLGMSVAGYVHRVGRCGRAAALGRAITFICDADQKLVPELLELLGRARQAVPDWLREIGADAQRAAIREAQGGGRAELTEEEQYDLQERIANRERQRQALRTKKTKGRTQSGKKKKKR